VATNPSDLDICPPQTTLSRRGFLTATVDVSTLDDKDFRSRNPRFTGEAGQSNQAISQTQATNLINSNPDLLALIPIDGAAVPGALAAVEAVGKAGKIGVFGIGDPNPNHKYFANGSLTGLFLWNEVNQGKLIAYVARDIYDGTMPAAGGSFTAGSLGTFTVTNSPAPGTIIFSKPLEFTKANYLQYNF